MTNLADVERDKYEQVWKFKQYQESESPGFLYTDAFFKLLDPKEGQSVYDVGCGRGVAGVELERRGLKVKYVDITDSRLLPEVNRDNFTQGTLWNRSWVKDKLDFALCCDVMEHIPPEYTMLVADIILSSADKCFFTICNAPDNFGPALIGQPLHLTIKPFRWWVESFEQIGNVLDARDLCTQTLLVVSK